MPDLIGSINSLGSSLIGGTADAWMQGKQNKYQREMALDFYNRQRKDALSDWAMQNEYNHPSSQMARLREAKLNPNLVYGNGATSPSAVVRGNDLKGYAMSDRKEERMSGSLSLDQYFDAQVKQAQVDNLRVQNTVSLQEQILKAAETRNVDQRTASDLSDLRQRESLRETEADLRRVELRNKEREGNVLLNRDEREAIAQSQTIAESVARIVRMRTENMKDDYMMREIKQRTMLMYQDESIKDFEIDMYKAGYRPGDPLYQRKVMDILNWIWSGYGKLGDILKLPFKGVGKSVDLIK